MKDVICVKVEASIYYVGGKVVESNEKNLSTKEKTKKKSAWFQKENAYSKRKKRA